MQSSSTKEHEAAPATEAQLRQEVAATTLLLNSLDILGYSGHVTARLPGRDAFLIQPSDMSRAEVGPDDLLICDFDANTVEGPKGVKPPSELFPHCEIYRARPDVQAVAHFHHDLTNVFTLVEDVPLVPFKNHAVRWASGIPVHPDPDHIHSAEMGKGIVKTLGEHHAMQIRAHGQIITAESVRGVFIDSVHFVENAVAGYHAASMGRVRPLTAKEIETFLRGVRRGHHIKKLWNYYVRGAMAKGLIPEDWSVLSERK